MMKKLVFLLLILGISVAGILASPKIEPPDETVVAFVNVSVIPMDTERVLANQTVIVRNGLSRKSAMRKG